MSRSVVRPDALIGPPLHQVGRPCRWCKRPIRMMYSDARYDAKYDADGKTHCTPADRGRVPGRAGDCVFGYYGDESVMGPTVVDKKGKFVSGAFDPLTLSHHDGTCSCNRSLPHTWDLDTPAVPYPWPDLLPDHCGQPMQMRFYAPRLAAELGRAGGWHCRAGGTDLERGVIVPRGCQVVLTPVDAQPTIT